MRGILRIARTEVLEHRRQPRMVFILAATYVFWFLLVVAPFTMVEKISSQPELLEIYRQNLAALGFELDAMLELTTSLFSMLFFTTLSTVVAIMSGLSVLHDRECGTMPFLMLAPITRRQLLVGKLAGAMTIPLVLHFLFVGASGLLLMQLESLAPYASNFGASTAWWVAYVMGAPASAAFVGSLGTVISALSRDVRTSMQYTNFFIGILSFVIGFVLVEGISMGALFQVVYASVCLVLTAITLLIGAQLISRDVTE